MSYFVVQDWMVERLGLRGAKRDAYAIVFGFSQDGEGCFDGRLGRIAGLIGVSERTARKVLHELADEGLLTMETTSKHGRICNEYRIVPLEDPGEPATRKKVPGTPEKSSGSTRKKVPGTPEKTSPPIVSDSKGDSKGDRNARARTEADPRGFAAFAKEAIARFNARFGTSWPDMYAAGCQLELARAYNDGYGVADIDAVLANTDDDWSGPEMRRNLRPRTVFRHFAEHVDANYVPKTSPGKPRSRAAPMEPAAPAVPDFEGYGTCEDRATPEEIAAITAAAMRGGGS